MCTNDDINLPGGTEGTWGSDHNGDPRAGMAASGQCGNLARANDGICDVPPPFAAKRVIDKLRRLSREAAIVP